MDVTRPRLTAALAVATSASAVPTVRQDIRNIDFLGASSTDAQGDRNGALVARGGDWLALAAPGDSSLRFYERVGNAWVYRSRVDVPAPGITSLAMNERVAVVGQPTAGAGGGAIAYIRTGTQWTTHAMLTSGQIAAGDEFGGSVAIDPLNDAIVVGAKLTDGVETDAGAAYVYTRAGNSWVVQQRLTPTAADAGGTGDRFGATVAIAAGRIAVSGPAGYGSTVGYVRLFRFDGAAWTTTVDISPSGFGFWGESLALSDDALVIGDASTFDFVFGTTPGRVAVYSRVGEGWRQDAYFSRLVEDYSFRIGKSVALSGDRAVAGSGDGSRLITFRRSGGVWALEHEIDLAPIDGPADRLTSGLALNADQIIAGAPQHDEPGVADAGIARVLMEDADAHYADLDVRDATGTTPVATATTLELVDLPDGAPTTLTLTLHNAGDAELAALATSGLSAPLAASLGATTVAPGGPAATLTIGCNLAAVGDSTTQTLRIASNDPDEPFVDYRVHCLTPSAGDVAVTIDDGTATLAEGATTRYAITVRNRGLPLHDVRIVSPLAATLGFGSWSCTVVRDGACDTGNGVGGVDATVDLGSEAEIVFTLDATVTGADGEFVAQSVTAQVPTGQADADASNNTATDTNAVGANAVFADGFEE